MIDPITFAFSQQGSRLESFADNSRYRGLPLLVHVDANGVEHIYVGRRFLPPPEALAEAGQVEVQEGDRIDNIAAQIFGDAELYWRIVDANRVLTPGELTQRIGRRLRITLSEGMPGRGS
ncbi:MAG: LysM domain-containing protein [Nitrosomonas sp.]|nr:LysM domain-containing protein [Nitrosomonas sp.]